MKKEYYIYLCVLVALLPVMFLRDFTPSNELRYLSIADEAIRTGHFFAFTNQGIPYADKPPLYLWIVILGRLLFGSHQMWFLSLFSLLPAFGCTYLMNKWTFRELTPSSRMLATLMLLSCAMFAGTAVVLRMDMLMTLFIMLALHSFYRMVTDDSYLHSRRSLLFGLYMFLALFTKGPLGILIPLISAYVFLACTGRIRRAAYFTGGWKTWAILLGGCIVWFGLVYIDGGGSYLNNLLFHQTVDRAVNAFHHKRPFYYYLYCVWYDMLPWSLLTLGLIITAACRRRIQTDLEKLFLTVICCTFVMLSLISSKLDVYLVPAYPFIIYAGTIYLQRIRCNGWIYASIILPVLAFAAAFPVFCIFAQKPEGVMLQNTWFYTATALLSCSGLCALYFMYIQRNFANSVRSLTTGLFAAVFAGGFGLPSVNDMIGYRNLCHKAVEQASILHTDKFYTWKMYRPENMDVFLHTRVNILPDEQPVPDHLNNCILMVPEKEAGSISNKAAQFIVGHNAIIVLRH